MRLKFSRMAANSLGDKFSVLALFVLIFTSSPTHAETFNSQQRLKQFAKLPDWSGIWEIAEPPQTIDPHPVPPADKSSNKNGDITLYGTGVGFFANNVRNYPPYNAEWEARYSKGFESIEHPMDKAALICTAGFPRLMAAPFMIEFVVTPEKTWMIFTQREVRNIYTDGRQHPKEDDLWSTYWGDSVGHWEGDTLVVDTIAMDSEIAIDTSGLFLSNKARIGERIRKVGELIEDQITIYDPVAFTKPWQFTRHYKRVTDINRMLDEDCTQNNRNPIVNGEYITILKEGDQYREVRP